MLSKVKFENYRCFANTTMTLKDITLIVGKNNAGKSTVIEALRLISMAGNKSETAIFIEPFKSLNLPLSNKGFRILPEKLKIDLRSIVYFYEDTNAKITATFSDKSSIVLYLNTDFVFACLFNAEGGPVTTRGKAKLCDFGSISILPQIGLIKENEKFLTRETVTSDKDTYLSSRHYRNELLLAKKSTPQIYDDFCHLAESTWPGLRIYELTYNAAFDEYIHFLIEDMHFTAELGLMGSGIQMWLQIIWFICRSYGSETIILDEPDVYMHPDLQRKLIKFVRNRFRQVIIATHSIEIISEVEPRNIITIDKDSKIMRYANSKKSVQNIIDGIGSIHNISLVRLANAKKCLFVEGKDLHILSKIHDTLYPDSDFSLEVLPCVSLGGWSRLDEAFGASKLFHDETEDDVKCYCVLDRDYYPQEAIDSANKKANECFLFLHIWKKKEIENYIIVPSTLFRMSGQPQSKREDFMANLDLVIDSFKDIVFEQLTNQISKHNKGKEVSTCMAIARNIVDENWLSMDGKISLVCGKDLIKKINEWMQSTYAQHCSVERILRNLHADEVAKELRDVIDTLKNK